MFFCWDVETLHGHRARLQAAYLRLCRRWPYGAWNDRWVWKAQGIRGWGGVSAHEFHAWNWNFQIFSTKRGMDGVNGWELGLSRTFKDLKLWFKAFSWRFMMISGGFEPQMEVGFPLWDQQTILCGSFSWWLLASWGINQGTPAELTKLGTRPEWQIGVYMVTFHTRHVGSPTNLKNKREYKWEVELRGQRASAANGDAKRGVCLTANLLIQRSGKQRFGVLRQQHAVDVDWIFFDPVAKIQRCSTNFTAFPQCYHNILRSGGRLRTPAPPKAKGWNPA